MTSNVYSMTSAIATKKYQFPKNFIDWISRYPSKEQALFFHEISLLGEQAFYDKYSQLASYQLQIGQLNLELIPAREKFMLRRKCG